MNETQAFDYIIVGAGTAGCLMANRLSADRHCRVLLVEAGGRDNYHWIHIPVGYLYCIGNPRTDWGFFTEEDPGLNGRKLRYPRGKVLGGCSSINGMIYMRGQQRDYDGWAALSGDDSWRWEHCLPMFKCHEDHWRGADAWHGEGNEWRIDKQRLRWDILDAFAAAAREAGIPLPTTSTAATTKAWATLKSTRRRAGAGTPARPSCARYRTAPTWRCGPGR
jgi:choline dehydrogenase